MLQRAEVSMKEIVLEINASVAPGLVGMPGETVMGKMVRQIQNWLPVRALFLTPSRDKVYTRWSTEGSHVDPDGLRYLPPAPVLLSLQPPEVETVE